MKLNTRLLLLILILIGISCQQAPETAVQPTATPSPQPTVEDVVEATAVPTSQPEAAILTLTFSQMEQPEALLNPRFDMESYPPKSPIIFYFNQPMNPGSSSRPFSVSPHETGEYSWSEDHKQLTFVPNEPLQADRRYTLLFNSSLKSEAGEPLSGEMRWRIRTEDTPRVLSHRPTSHQTTDMRPPIQMTFSHFMDEASLLDALTINPPLDFETEWDGNILRLTLNEPLRFGEMYRVMVEDTAVAQNGTSLYLPFETTLQLSDPLRSVNWRVEPNQPATLNLSWNYSIDIEDDPQFTLSPAADGTWEWDDDQKLLTFQPDDVLPPNADYVVNIPPLTTSDGVAIPQQEPVPFNTGSPVLSAIPGDGRQSDAQNIQIQFDRPMDTATVEAAFNISPEVSGTFTWRENKLIFTPDQGYFEFDQTYSYWIDIDAQSNDGFAILSEPAAYTFKTAAYGTVADFGDGVNVQVLDADGRRAIQYRARFSSSIPLQAALYRFDETDFIDLFLAEYDPEWWQETGLFELPSGIQPAYRWATETVPARSDWNHLQELIVPDDVPAGLYVLEIGSGNRKDHLLLTISQNNVTAKMVERQLTVWLTDGGETAVSNATITLLNEEGTVMQTAQTDDIGIAKFELDPEQRPYLVLAQSGSDVTISGLDGAWQQGGYWWWGNNGQFLEYAVHTITDRPIYKPGQTVYYKAIVRRDNDAELSLLPNGSPVTVRFLDARQNVIRTDILNVNDYGTLHGSFDMANGAMLGEYSLEIVIDGETHAQPFKVEEYRKPDYEITLSSDKEEYVVGENVQLTIEAAYFYGEPVSNGRVTVKQFRLEHNYGYGISQQEYIWATDWSADDRTARLDEDGNLLLHLPARTSFDDYFYYGNNLRSQKIGLEVTVNDGSNQTVSNFVVVTLFNQEESINIDTRSYVHRQGNPVPVDVHVTTIDGRPVPNRPVELTIRRYNRSTYNYDNVTDRITLTTDANGTATFTLEDLEGGYMQLFAESTDSEGNMLQARNGLYILSENQTSWYRDDNSLVITPDKESYQAGETAVLAIESQLAGPALLTIERGTVRRQMEVNLTPPLTQLELPIVATDAPNIHVTISGYMPQTITELSEDVWQSLPDANLVSGSVNLSVPATDKQLTVTITPDNESYAPGEEATFTVRVTNASGTPVAAELSAALVDDAIFALSEELSGPIYDGFYFERDNLVRTYHSYGPIRYLGGGGGGGGGGASIGSPRADFQDTAVWLPTLRTDFNGEAQFSVTLPDNLTRWRLTVKATTTDTQVGEAIDTIITEQPIVVRPLLPRTLTTGDTVELSTLLHNYTNTPQTLSVTLAELNTTHLTLQSDPTQTVTIPANGSQIVGWTAVAQSAGEMELLVTAVTPNNTLADGVQLPLMVEPLAIPNVETAVGEFTSQLNNTVTIPDDALDMSEVTIELSRSIAGSLLQGLDDLTGFPYGCVEQTMSKALPNAVVGRALTQLGIADPELEAELTKQINQGVQRLYGFQHEEGSWGWWHDDDAQAYQTAWVLFGLATTANAGYEVDPDVLANAANWLSANWAAMDARTQAFAIYSMTLAGHGEEAKADSVRQKLNELDAFAVAALALTYHGMGDTIKANQMLDHLAEMAEESNGRVTFPGAQYDGGYDRKTMASTIRNTGLALSAFAQIAPGHALESGMVRYLMSQRRPFGWGTTNETAFTIIGLTDHLVGIGFTESGNPVNYTVTINGTPFQLGTLDAGQPSITVTVPRNQLRSGDNQIGITQQGANRLYYVIHSRILQPQEAIEAEGTLEVSRTYHAPDSPARLTTFAAGELVEVRLQVKTDHAMSYVIIEDQLPAGLEALNERLNTSSHEGIAYEQPTFYWRTYGYNQKEIRDDRVTFFVTEILPGTHTITYLARVTQPGTVTAMPTEAYAMYELEMWGRSETAVLTFTAE